MLASRELNNYLKISPTEVLIFEKLYK